MEDHRSQTTEETKGDFLVLVFITHDWDSFKVYSENCRVGTYQLRKTTEGSELRVMTGRLGFKRQFKLANNGEHERQEFLDDILTFCEIQGFINVEGSIPDEQFHA